MATPAPSQFAALLRQSRFASFDPAIGQVYASYGGHAHRGNWGLKRPLPLRRRKGNVTVQAIDSFAQQTEWKSGESQSRWIQMWEEVGLQPKVGDGPWRERLGPTGEFRWDIDSEFGLTTRDDKKKTAAKSSRDAGLLRLSSENEEREATDKGNSIEEMSEAIPNIYSMKDKEFEYYLQKVREMRPAFLDYLREKAKKKKKKNEPWTSDEHDSLWGYREMLDFNEWKSFFMSRAFKDYSSHDSRIIEQQPQLYGGLVYARQSVLQSKLLAEPQPGRILERLSGQGGGASNGDYIASFAGMTPYLNKHLTQNKSALNWQSLGASTDAPDAMRGTTALRMAHASFIAPPSTVNPKPRGLESVTMDMEVYVPPEVEHGKENPYPPGSREYVGYQKITPRGMTQKSVKKKDVWRDAEWLVPDRDAPAENLLHTLGGIVKGQAEGSKAGPPSEPSS
ncbi:hypothetical protein DAEQUDRAFT_764830 [Daedalea quercina L-15889]|uniref:Uncharacterized protein n=1 Tax=Daedalea quercina L-15889 TaxID=1314783 RepID=A0A165QXZ2_9APHY|nr:hypothetical protein DAEQUDRAFT_764830 [Daedalea quercina L-15889]